eukprot:TRINITY_DN3687_c1_g1_i1.p1 TRINITY_DN3687_c1_g1~~TRINITY_DN3687_c1_g1_i1.p1  ORF type:complete len:685 (-),score=29.01 TRINITY_DN3687_c1_g1_i1:1365-3125(-)
MIPEMDKKKFLPLFQECMEIAMVNPIDKLSWIARRVPMECQVLSTDPKLVLSDGFHKVACEVSKEALLNLKKYYPTIKVKDLNKCVITLLEYAPHTHLEANGTISPTLHIYDLLLRSPENQKHNTIVGKPKDLGASEDIKARAGYETSKHLKRYLVAQRDINNLPPLENILLRSTSGSLTKHFGPTKGVIKYEARKYILGDELGKNILNYSDLDYIEEKLTEEAVKDLQREKEEKRKEKEQGRKHAKQRKEKPRSLGKDIKKWVDSWKIKKEMEAKKEKPKVPNFIQEGVAKFIAKENTGTKDNSSLKSTSKMSIRKSTVSKQGTVGKRSTNPSEMKFTAKGFKNFLTWRVGSGNRDSQATDVTDLLKKSKAGTIKVDFAAPTKPTRKAFENWASAETPGKKRSLPEGVSSVRKSTTKKPKPYQAYGTLNRSIFHTFKYFLQYNEQCYMNELVHLRLIHDITEFYLSSWKLVLESWSVSSNSVSWCKYSCINTNTPEKSNITKAQTVSSFEYYRENLQREKLPQYCQHGSACTFHTRWGICQWRQRDLGRTGKRQQTLLPRQLRGPQGNKQWPHTIRLCLLYRARM